MTDSYKALLAEDDGGFVVNLRELTLSDLPDGEVTVSVAYSSLNYKDGLALCGNKGRVIRRFPMVPGIDFSGVVEESSSSEFKKGDAVLATGWGLGETYWGGYAQMACVPAEWLIRVPDGLDLLEVMSIGTAGLTAMLSVMALEHHGLEPGGLPMVVTGAAGGVGSIAILLLSKLGYHVIASSGRPDAYSYLSELGANEIINRADLEAESEKPLEQARFQGGIDSVGGRTLARILSQTCEDGLVASCGNAGGLQLATTVLPFILRGVGLIGINSPSASVETRKKAWSRLANELPRQKLSEITTVAPLTDLPVLAENILDGRVRGRTVIDLNG